MHHQRGLGRMAVGASALALSAVVWSPQAVAQQAATAAQAPTDADDSANEPIVVTGSRIASSFNAPTPVTAIGAERLQQRAAPNIGDALNELPAFRSTQ